MISISSMVANKHPSSHHQEYQFDLNAIKTTSPSSIFSGQFVKLIMFGIKSRCLNSDSEGPCEISRYYRVVSTCTVRTDSSVSIRVVTGPLSRTQKRSSDHQNVVVPYQHTHTTHTHTRARKHKHTQEKTHTHTHTRKRIDRHRHTDTHTHIRTH